jgi:hypothetical protein
LFLFRKDAILLGMKWILFTAAFAGVFIAGYKTGHQEPPAPETLEGVRADFEQLSKEDLRDYQELKDNRKKYEAANQILAKIMKIFVADLGLRISTQQQCQVNSPEFSPAPKAAVADTPPTVEPPPPPAPAATPSSAPSASTPSNTRNRDRASEQSRGNINQNRRNNTNSSSFGLVFGQERAKGAIHALYQAILWRAPDVNAEGESTTKFSEEGWGNYVAGARKLIRSQEFVGVVAPNHTPEQIINRIYAVYAGRCAFANEMSRSMRDYSSGNHGGLVATVIGSARRLHADQVFAGGFSPASCNNEPTK